MLDRDVQHSFQHFGGLPWVRFPTGLFVFHSVYVFIPIFSSLLPTFLCPVSRSVVFCRVVCVKFWYQLNQSNSRNMIHVLTVTTLILAKCFNGTFCIFFTFQECCFLFVLQIVTWSIEMWTVGVSRVSGPVQTESKGSECKVKNLVYSLKIIVFRLRLCLFIDFVSLGDISVS